uniref:LisH domain-containing protein n=1 Tax=Cucumis sativus TaxID=3659 RepID=A0A0A0KWK0_CUCSA
MENMQYAEELVREFLVFRGFTSALQSYESELSTDIGKGFQVDRILDLIFSVYIPNALLHHLTIHYFQLCQSWRFPSFVIIWYMPYNQEGQIKFWSFLKYMAMIYCRGLKIGLRDF